jgi:hypothetical protein
MRKLFLIFAAMVLLPFSAEAAPRKTFTIVGLWQATATVAETFIHHNIDMRQELGQEFLYISNAQEHATATVNISWAYQNKTLTRYSPDGTPASGTVEVISRTKIAITHNSGFAPLRGMTLIYTLQEDQDAEGC